MAELSVDEERRLRDPDLTHVVSTYFPSDRTARILDLGCGAGLLVEKARKLGYTAVSGVEQAREQIALAEAAGVAGIEQADGLAYLAGQPEASVDCLVAIDILEHVPKAHLAALMEEIVRVLRPGGRLIVHVPNGASPFGGRVVFGDLTHETVFTAGSMTQLLRAFGFVGVVCRENMPVGRGWRGAVRRIGWRAIRSMIRLAIALETGDRSAGMVLTQTFYCLAMRPD